MQTISKLDAARLQLNTAIRLWLHEDDLASIQTLGWAALTILRDLKKAAGRPLSSGSDRKWEFDRDAANFLKHADKDPDAWLLEIDPWIPEFVFHEALRLYADLAKTTTREMDVARTVLDIKYGFSEIHAAGAEKRRKRRREIEQQLDDAYDEEEYTELKARLDFEERIEQSAVLAIGRSMLFGEELFPKDLNAGKRRSGYSHPTRAI